MKIKLLLLILLLPILLYSEDRLTYSFALNHNNPSIFLGDEVSGKFIVEEIYFGYGLVSNRWITNCKLGLKYKVWSLGPIVGTIIPNLSEMDTMIFPVHIGLVLQYEDYWDFISIELPLYNTPNSMCSEYNSSIILRFGFKF